MDTGSIAGYINEYANLEVGGGNARGDPGAAGLHWSSCSVGESSRDISHHH